MYNPNDSNDPLNDPANVGSPGQSNVPKKAFKDASPDEVREMMKDRVAKGLAAVTGALEGFIERSQRGELADKTRNALQEAGHTTREAIRGTSEQMDKTRQTAKESGIASKAKEAVQKAGETARRVGETAKDEYQQTRDKMGKGSHGSTSVGSSSIGGSSGFGSTSPSSSPSTSSIGGTSDATKGVPDIRKTKLGTQDDLKDI